MSDKTDPAQPVTIPSKSTPVEAGEPVEQPQISQAGSTFAERRASREKAEKAVSKGSGTVEDKAVKRASKKASK